MATITLEALHDWIENNGIYSDGDLPELVIIKDARRELLLRLECAQFMPTYNSRLQSIKNKKMVSLTALLAAAVRFIEKE